MSNTNVLVHTAAGTSAGVLTTVLLYPVDSIRTRITAQDGTTARHAYGGGSFRGTAHAFRCIVQHDGAAALYRGVTPALLGSSVSWGMFFGINRWLQNRVTADLSRPVKNFLCSGTAGLVTACVTTPIWLVKTRMQLIDRSLPTEHHYRSMADAFRKIWRAQGLRGLFRGVGPQCLMVSTSIIQYVVYEQLKALSYQMSGAAQDRKLPNSMLLPCIVGSKVVATTTTNPLLVVKIRMQDVRNDLPGTAVRYRSVRSSLQTIYSREGVRGFFKGLAPGLLRVIPSAVVTYLSYEQLADTFARWQLHYETPAPH